MKKNFIFLLCIIVILVLETKGLNAKISQTQREFFIQERILLKNLPSNIKDLRIWIPYPVIDNCQELEDFKLTGSFNSHFLTDREYGNTIIYLDPKQNILDKNISEITLSFKVKRKECNAYLNQPASNRILWLSLRPNRLIPTKGSVKTLAKKITQGKTDDLERVRAIYDYLIDELTYYKDDPKICGIGNSLLTLKFKKGICTDYHSLFISLVRSLGIPAKFEIGFRIPEGVSESKLNGYHCWAKFYVKDKGWIPVDISEADKHPEKRDYFFGHIDENRFHLTSGRDIRLKYAKNKEPLNFFVYPYAELNDKQFTDFDIELWFKERGYDEEISNYFSGSGGGSDFS